MGKVGIDDISAGTADAASVGRAGRSSEVDAARVWGGAGDCAEHADVVAAGLPACQAIEDGNGVAAENPVVFTEVPAPANVPRTAAVLEIVAPSGHLVRVLAGADGDTLQRVLQSPADNMLTLPGSVRVFVARGATEPAPVVRSTERTSAGGAAPGPVVRPRVRVLQPPTQSGILMKVAGVGTGRVLALLYKRLEAGTFAVLDRDEINARELYLLLAGLEVIRERRRYTRLPTNV